MGATQKAHRHQLPREVFHWLPGAGRLQAQGCSQSSRLGHSGPGVALLASYALT